MINHKKILVVEDEEFLRNLYVEILSQEGYQVDQAQDGKEGYLAMFKGGYDLVLLDIMLPKMDGLQILARLKKETPPKKINKAVVVLSNLSQEINFKECTLLGAKGYLIKSDLNPGELLAEVKKYL